MVRIRDGAHGDHLASKRETTAERIEVQRPIAADAATNFRVLCDPQGHVGIDSSGMLMAATGDPVTAVDDTFVVHMGREALNDHPLGLYDVTVRILTHDQDREIAWAVEGGTLVTSYYDGSAIESTWREADIFPVIPESALRATLGILARTVTPGEPRLGA